MRLPLATWSQTAETLTASFIGTSYNQHTRPAQFVATSPGTAGTRARADCSLPQRKDSCYKRRSLLLVNTLGCLLLLGVKTAETLVASFIGTNKHQHTRPAQFVATSSRTRARTPTLPLLCRFGQAESSGLFPSPAPANIANAAMAQRFRSCVAALMFLPTLVVALAKIAKVKNYFNGDVAGDERVVFFPTVASKLNATHWRVPIHAWLFEPEQDSKKRKLAIEGVGSLFQVKDESERRYLNARIFPFIVDNKSMKFLNVKLGRDVYKLSRTSKDGHSTTKINIAEEKLRPMDDMMTYQVIDDARLFEGNVFFVEDQGLSISKFPLVCVFLLHTVLIPFLR